MDELTDDAAALTTTLGLAPCHFVGVSMGGFAGTRLAIRRPELLRSLVPMSAPPAARPLATSAEVLLVGAVARLLGYGHVAGLVMSNFFGRTFKSNPGRLDERRYWHAQIAAADQVGTYRTILHLVSRRSVTDQLHRIVTPTLVIAGDEDTAVPPEQARAMAERIPRPRFVTIPEAGHYGIIGQPNLVTHASADFTGQESGASRVSTPVI